MLDNRLSFGIVVYCNFGELIVKFISNVQQFNQ
jgi:hypothetical protein